MGFLLLSKGCIPGPHDFAFVSGLASHSGCLGPREFTLVSDTCLPLWVPWAAWVYTCLPLWVSWAAWVYTCLPLVSHTCLPHLSPTLGVLGRMILHLFPTCLPHLSPTLGALGRMNLHLSSTCLPHLSPTLVSHTCLPHLSPHSGFLGPHEFTLFTLVFPLSPTLGSLGRMNLHLSSPCLPHLSLTLGALGGMSLQLSPTCLPHLSPALVSHSGCLGPHEFTLVSHLSPTLVFHTCLPLWVPWAAWVYTCLPLVSHTCLPHLSPTLGALGRILSPTLVSNHKLWRRWPCTADEDLPFASAPVVCQLCHCGFAGFDALLVHCREKHGNWWKLGSVYRKQLFFHAREAGLQPIRSWTKRAMIRNFSFFQSFSVPCSLNDWSRKTLTHCQPRALGSTRNLCSSWLFRKQVWNLPIHGTEQQNFVQQVFLWILHRCFWRICSNIQDKFCAGPYKAITELLAVEKYAALMPQIQVEELHASSIQHPRDAAARWLLHTRRVKACQQTNASDSRPPCAGVGTADATVWVCKDCLLHLAHPTHPTMPPLALANLMWLVDTTRVSKIWI